MPKSETWSGLFRVTPVEDLLRAADGAAGGLEMPRRLGPLHLILMGVGVIVGAGIFMVTGSAAAQFAGPAIVLSFVLAAVGCAFCGLCYAEFASLMPVSGSAYTYAAATLGEVVAWAIGWNLLMEYAFAASYVAVGWSAYCVNLLNAVGVHLPPVLTSSPLGAAHAGLINLPAVVLVLAMAFVASRGIGLSATVNALIVLLKLAALVLFLGFGAHYVHPQNWRPFVPPNQGAYGHFGWSGMLRGAAVVFVAYLGFDALATTAQEVRNPQRNLPIGILGSLVLCTLLYGGVSLVLTGLVPYGELNAPNPLTVALRGAGGALNWLVPVIDAAAIVGLASVMLVVLLAQPRVLYAMARDGLLPRTLARLGPKTRTPGHATLVAGSAVAILAGLFPIDILVQLVSLGTLSVFIAAVCVGVIVLRRTRPDLKRPFRVPPSPVIPVLGVGICVYLLAGLPGPSWALYGGWTVVGGLIYALYGRRSATRLRQAYQASPTPSQTASSS